MFVINEVDYHTTRWDGGLTREICIFPENGSYQARDFRVRISSAVIEKEESDFTLLPGVHRFLMMQEGTARLVFADGREKLLEPLEVFEFEGDERIRCYGTGTDLNLMLKDGAEGRMSCIRCAPGETLLIPENGNYSRAVYVIGGSASVSSSQGEAVNKPGKISEADSKAVMTVKKGSTAVFGKDETVSVVSSDGEELRLALFEWRA